MAQRNSYHLFILLALIQSTFPQRRIKDGKEVISDKKYVVYLLKAASAPNQYHGWLCGGAIINKDYVVTSAACVQDVRHIYVIPGYKKYVSADKIDEDECVREKKKKVILTCVPRTYQFDINKTEMWAKVDIAVVKVESSFDFKDKSYERICSYTPQPIDFNTEKEFPKPGDDVIVLGWGHSKQFRKDTELVDMNQATLHYAPTRVLEEEICVTYFSGNKALATIIASSMLCTLEPGNLDDKGELILRSPPIAQGCISQAARLRGAIGRMCEDEERAESMIYEGGVDGPDLYDDGPGGDIVIVNDTRRQHSINASRPPGNNTSWLSSSYTHGNNTSINGNNTSKEHSNKTRKQNANDVTKVADVIDYEVEIVRQELGTPEGASVPIDLQVGEDTPGICQNDHGGPLVAWRGGQEVLVAVATLFKLDSKLNCMGPYLFTKTWCNGAFLNCIIDQEHPDKTRRRCDDPEEVGFEIVRRHISWVGHRDGPAENERIQLRHQVPMSAFQRPMYEPWQP